ncbi:hypothetical protein [Humidesulfovibrio idahonensis]
MSLFSLRAKGPLEGLLRFAGLLVVVGLMVLGFWKNSERNMERINERASARAGLSDEVKGLSDAERAHVAAFITTLRQTYGVEARVQVAKASPTPPEPDGKTLYLGLGLEDKTAVVQLPPLMARSLGPDFARSLEREHFPFHFGPGKSWQKGLLAALDLIESRLAALGAEQNAGRQSEGSVGQTAGQTVKPAADQTTNRAVKQAVKQPAGQTVDQASPITQQQAQPAPASAGRKGADKETK